MKISDLDRTLAVIVTHVRTNASITSLDYRFQTMEGFFPATVPEYTWTSH